MANNKIFGSICFPSAWKTFPFQNFSYLFATIDCLKRLAAILFLLILVFNLYGYRLMISYMSDASTARIEQKLDAAQYSDDELVSVKTKLNLPYYTNSNEFERAYGSINIAGKDYEYVKRRVHNDTLELLCLPNKAKTGLKSIGNDYAKASTDQSQEKKSTSVLKISLPDFFCAEQTIFSLSSSSLTTTTPAANTAFSFADYSLEQERPPQAI